MQAKQKITTKEVEKLAVVAGLKLTPERLEAVTARYLGFLDMMEKLKELDISNLEPAVVFGAGETKQ